MSVCDKTKDKTYSKENLIRPPYVTHKPSELRPRPHRQQPHLHGRLRAGQGLQGLVRQAHALRGVQKPRRDGPLHEHQRPQGAGADA